MCHGTTGGSLCAGQDADHPGILEERGQRRIWLGNGLENERLVYDTSVLPNSGFLEKIQHDARTFAEQLALNLKSVGTMGTPLHLLKSLEI